MSPEQKALLQETWHQVVPIADTASALFYERLFEIDPELRQLFDGVDMESQRQKLVQALALVIGGLDEIDGLVAEIAALGRRHAGYGVTDAHYETVGTALLSTLETGLGDSWNTEVKAAWTAAYSFIADVMRDAGNDGHHHPSGAPA